MRLFNFARNILPNYIYYSMGLEIISEHLNGLFLFKPKIHGDERGFFMETWRKDEFEKYGISANFVQDNHSRSSQNVLRGLHFQWEKPMGKLIRVTRGSCLFCELDLRPSSPSLGKSFLAELTEENNHLLWVPPGFANGFLTLSKSADVQYKCTALWNPNAESAVHWNDPELSIGWNLNNFEKKKLIISEKDQNAGSLKQWLSRPESKFLDF